MLRRRAVPLVLALVALAGCSGSDRETAPTLPPVAPTTAAPSPSATVPPGPTVPPEAQANTPTGAEAFARYFIDVLNEAARTFDPSTLVSISDPECLTCQAYIRSFRESAAARERYEGGLLTVTNTSAVPLPGGEQQVLLDFDADALTVYDRNGVPSNTNPSEVGATLVITLRPGRNSWVVREAVDA